MASDMSIPTGEEVIGQVRAACQDTLLAFSAGKDAIAAWLAIRPHFERVIPYYLYLVPGLEFVEESLAFYERFFGAKIARLPHSRLYDRRWRRARLSYLAAHPLCVMCQQQGRITPAAVVDHVVPHRGDRELFWRQDNWQALCKPHHDSSKQRAEHRGYAGGCDAAGIPIDPDHLWRLSDG